MFYIPKTFEAMDKVMRGLAIWLKYPVAPAGMRVKGWTHVELATMVVCRAGC